MKTHETVEYVRDAKGRLHRKEKGPKQLEEQKSIRAQTPEQPNEEGKK